MSVGNVTNLSLGDVGVVLHALKMKAVGKSNKKGRLTKRPTLSDVPFGDLLRSSLSHYYYSQFQVWEISSSFVSP